MATNNKNQYSLHFQLRNNLCGTIIGLKIKYHQLTLFQDQKPSLTLKTTQNCIRIIQAAKYHTKTLGLQQFSILSYFGCSMLNLEAQTIKIDNEPSQESSNCPNVFSYELIEIQQYLNIDFFPENHKSANLNNQSFQLCNLETLPSNCQRTDSLQKITQKRQKSIFHNFQKHLITLIRKFIRITINKCEMSNGRLVIKLWTAFTSERYCSKKILNLLLGMNRNDDLQMNMAKMLYNFPAFQRIYYRYSITDISAAQDWLKGEIVRQARHLEKDLIRQNSSINKFESFYLYFLAFIDDLQTGSFGRRMTKTTKSKVIKALAVEKRVQNLS